MEALSGLCVVALAQFFFVKRRLDLSKGWGKEHTVPSPIRSEGSFWRPVEIGLSKNNTIELGLDSFIRSALTYSILFTRLLLLALATTTS